MGIPAVARLKDGGFARAPRTSRLGVGAGRGSRSRVGDAALCVMAALEAFRTCSVESIMANCLIHLHEARIWIMAFL